MAGGFPVDDACPGDVVPAGFGIVGEFGPDIDEEEVARADGTRTGETWFVVGVG